MTKLSEIEQLGQTIQDSISKGMERKGPWWSKSVMQIGTVSFLLIIFTFFLMDIFRSDIKEMKSDVKSMTYTLERIENKLSGYRLEVVSRDALARAEEIISSQPMSQGYSSGSSSSAR